MVTVLIDALSLWCWGFRHVTAAYGVEGFTVRLAWCVLTRGDTAGASRTRARVEGEATVVGEAQAYAVPEIDLEAAFALLHLDRVEARVEALESARPAVPRVELFSGDRHRSTSLEDGHDRR